MERNIILVGLMGTGKTTIGSHLAKSYCWNHVDSDHWIEETAKQTIPYIFEHEGEQGFRERETNALRMILEAEKQVVTTGGGSPLREVNRKLMLGNGIVVALHANFSTIIERVRGDHGRPLLQGNLEERVRTLMDSRKGLYDFAPIQIDTSDKTVEEIVNQLKEMIDNRFSFSSIEER